MDIFKIRSGFFEVKWIFKAQALMTALPIVIHLKILKYIRVVSVFAPDYRETNSSAVRRSNSEFCRSGLFLHSHPYASKSLSNRW